MYMQVVEPVLMWSCAKLTASRRSLAGVGSAAAFRLNTSDPEGASSVLQIGVAYAIGVVMAFVVSQQPELNGRRRLTVLGR